MKFLGSPKLHQFAMFAEGASGGSWPEADKRCGAKLRQLIEVLQLYWRAECPTKPMARKIASGVAGASSGTGHPGARLWIASAIAANTEIASISGGSPTAFDR